MKISSDKNLFYSLEELKTLRIFKVLSMAVLITALSSVSYPGHKIFKSYSYASDCECTKNTEAPESVYKDGKLYDIYGREVNLSKPPIAAVSLVPAVSEIIAAVCPEYKLKGITLHDTNLAVSEKAEIVGGFYNPGIDKIKNIHPDIIFAASLHKKVQSEFKDSNVRVIILNAHNLPDIYGNIKIIGKIFRQDDKAEEITVGIRAKIENIQKKIGLIPADKRLRVLRIMGFDGRRLGTSGDDSFQDEAIKLAGGIPAITGKLGEVTYIEPSEWQKLNPQVVYTCGDSEKIWEKLSNAKEWNTVDAVKNNHHLVFPCNLTCRPSVNYGAFIEALAAALYGDHFFANMPVNKDCFNKEKKISIDVPYVKNASVRYGTVDDFEHKTLVIKLNHKMPVLSTLTGLANADTIGNHYLSPPRWNDGHNATIETLIKKTCLAVNEPSDSSAFLITGADMDNLAVVEKQYQDLKVYALVTAGVEGNAQRKSKNEGKYYPHGTINMIILSNAELSQGAMAAAIITATEAKTAALQDMDIRSSYMPELQATGTGTDNMIVISGEGKKLDSTGGHTKAGELIAKAVYEAVIKAIGMQNSMISRRSVFSRLEERKISLYNLASASPGISHEKVYEIVTAMENALIDKDISDFMETSMAISDCPDRDILDHAQFFSKWCFETAEKISGIKPARLVTVDIPGYRKTALCKALSAILTGAVDKIKNK